MRAGTRLSEQLRREALRREKMKHYEIAHELRRAAGDVIFAQNYLDGSKRMQSSVFDR